MLAAFLRRIYDGFDTSADFEPAMWREILRVVNEAAVEGLSQGAATPSLSADRDFYRAMRHSNEVFSAFKVHRMGREMAALLTDADGRLKPFSRWVEDVRGISTHYNRTWLGTEYSTAVIRAHNAADWRRFERDKDILPNLRWMPTTSPDPEGSHRAFWERKLTLPVDDGFWNRHHPGDRWNCKCTLEQTDDPATPELKELLDGDRPQPGLENNPGKDGHLFSQDHPYFPKSCSSCAFYRPDVKDRVLGFFNARKKDCYNCPYINACLHSKEEKGKIDNERAKELKKEASFLRERILTNHGFQQDVTISQRNIKEWINQPHKFYREKNELLLKLPEVFRKAKYIGETIDPKIRPGVAKSHIFEIELCGEPSYIVVHEMTWHEYHIYSISQHIKM